MIDPRVGYMLLGFAAGVAFSAIVHTAIVAVRMKRRFNRGVKA